MSLTISCPHCGNTGRVPASYVGREVRCPKCTNAFHVQGPETSPSEQSSPAKPQDDSGEHVLHEDYRYSKEVEALARLPPEMQREIIDTYRSVAKDPKVPRSERLAGIKRAEALERILKLQEPEK